MDYPVQDQPQLQPPMSAEVPQGGSGNPGSGSRTGRIDSGKSRFLKFYPTVPGLTAQQQPGQCRLQQIQQQQQQQGGINSNQEGGAGGQEYTQRGIPLKELLQFRPSTPSGLDYPSGQRFVPLGPTMYDTRAVSSHGASTTGPQGCGCQNLCPCGEGAQDQDQGQQQIQAQIQEHGQWYGSPAQAGPDGSDNEPRGVLRGGATGNCCEEPVGCCIHWCSRIFE